LPAIVFSQTLAACANSALGLIIILLIDKHDLTARPLPGWSYGGRPVYHRGDGRAIFTGLPVAQKTG